MRATREKQSRRNETPVSIRLEGSLREEIRSLARRTGRPMSRVIKEMLAMALRMQRFPGIIFIEGPAGRRAHLIGTGLDVWEVVELLQEYGSVNDLLEHFPRLTQRAVHTAEAYAKAYPEEIKAFLDLNVRTPEHLKREVPWLEAGRS